MTRSNNRSPRAHDELNDDALDAVVGGWSVGVYGNVGYLGPVTTGNATVAIGVQSSFPFVTGGIYTNHGDGISTGASVGVSAGVFGATGNADSYFTGPGYSASLGVDAIGHAGVEGGVNSSGVSLGLNAGVGVAAFGFDGVGVQGSVMHTEGTSVLEGNGNFNMNPPTGNEAIDHGVPTSSPGEYAGYFNASQSPPLDHYEPNSPELNAAINAINNDHSGDSHDSNSDAHASDAGHDNSDVSHSDPLDRSEPSSPELDQAIGASHDDGGHASDAGHDNSDSHGTDSNGADSSGDHFNGNDFDGHDSGSTQVASNDGGGGGGDFGGDFGGGDFGGGDFGGGDFA